MKEKDTETGREDDLAAHRVQHAGITEGPAFRIGPGKDTAGNHRQHNGRPVAVEKMGQTKRPGISQDRQAKVREKRAITFEEQHTKDNFLGDSRDKRISDHDDQPHIGIVAWQRQQPGGHQPHGERKTHERCDYDIEH